MPEYAFYSVGILLLLGAFVPVIEGRQNIPGHLQDGSPLRRVLTGGLLVGSLLLLLPHLSAVKFNLRKNVLLVILIAMAPVSFFWSVEPIATITRGGALVAISLFGACLAIRLTPMQVLRVVVTSTVIAAVASVLLAVVAPDLGLHRDVHWGSLRGVFNHKNPFGRAMVLGMIAMAGIILLDGRVRLRWVALSTGMFTLVILSRSGGALILTAFLGVCGWLFWFLRTYRLSNAVVVLICAVTLLGTTAIAVTQWERVLTAVGKSTQLTGRVPMWLTLADRVSERPLLGYGYDAFFESDRMMSAFVYWIPSSAHNGYVQLAVDLGGVGVGLFMCVILIVGVRTVSVVLHDPRQFWIPLLLIYILISNVSESHLVNFARIYWALFVYVNVALVQIRPCRVIT